MLKGKTIRTKCIFLPKGDEGFSLPAVIMAAAILLISAVGISKAFIFSKQNQNDVAIRQSANKFQNAMRNTLAKRIRNFVLDGCSGNKYKTTGGSTTPPLQLAFANLMLSSDNGGSASMSYTTTPISNVSSYNDAINRCKTPQNMGTIGSGQFSYFCMKLAADSAYKAKKTTGKSSFWLLNDAFMEVMFSPVDLSTDQSIRCNQVSDSGAQGVKVFYTIYYSNKTGEKYYDSNSAQDSQELKYVYLGKKMNGVFYVSGAK